jgi:hypothetical protein
MNTLLLSLLLAPAMMRVDAFDPAAAVVKIYSKSSSQTALFTGSGTLFQQNGDVYVLTSEHVLLHSNVSATHVLVKSDGKSVPAEYVAADWGYGLALMKVPAFPPEQLAAIPHLSDLEAAPEKCPGMIGVFGYPADSTSLIRSVSSDSSCGVVDPAYSFPLLPEVPGLIELKGQHVEFGMSGGPSWAFDGGGKAYLEGVISHQRVLDNNPGELAPSDDPSRNLALLIPGRTALDWLGRYFKEPAHFQIKLWKEPNFQLQPDTPFVQSTNVYWQWVKDYMPGRNEVLMALYHPSEANTLIDNTFGDMKAIVQKLPAAQKDAYVYFTFFRRRVPISDPAHFYPQLETFSSLEAFMVDLQSSDLEPMGEKMINDWDQADDAMVQLGQDIMSFAGKAQAKQAGSQMISDLYSIGQTIGYTSDDGEDPTEAWRNYNVRDIDALMNDPLFAADRQLLQTKGLDQEFNALMTRVRSQFDAMTI